jgi:hypothetical protein
LLSMSLEFCDLLLLGSSITYCIVSQTRS